MLPMATTTVADLQAFVKSEIARWGKVVHQAGIAGLAIDDKIDNIAEETMMRRVLIAAAMLASARRDCRGADLSVTSRSPSCCPMPPAATPTPSRARSPTGSSSAWASRS